MSEQIKKGIIKINPVRFNPIILYACGEKYEWNKKVENIISIDVTPRQQKYALNNTGSEVEFYINKKDFGVIIINK